MARIIKTLHNTFGFEEFFIPQQSITFLRKSQYLNYSGQQINLKKADGLPRSAAISSIKQTAFRRES